jgi:hypothetical protein
MTYELRAIGSPIASYPVSAAARMCLVGGNRGVRLSRIRPGINPPILISDPANSQIQLERGQSH